VVVVGKNRDLRRVTLLDLQQVLDSQRGARSHRIACIKHLYTYLRERGRLTRNEDPSLDLKQPPVRPTKDERAVSRKDFEATLAKLGPPYHDILVLQSLTGMHVTEALRLAQGEGTIASRVLVLAHKSGREHRMSVDERASDAAQRLRDRGGFSVSRYSKAVREAATAAGVRPWAPGSMRHTVGTWLVEEGAPLAEVSAWLGHASVVTTRRSCAKHAKVPQPVTKVTATA